MRYERKYKVEYLQEQVITQALRFHPLGLKRLYPDRQINNIYFDTSSLTTYHDNVNGVPHRQKFRVRWYGEDIFRIQNPNFEIKIRNNEVGRKITLPISEFQLYDLRSLTKQVNDLAPTIVPLMPTLINSYLRSYFGTPDGRFRVTIDRHLRYFSPFSANRFTRYVLEDFAVIMEIKYDEAHDNDTNLITKFLPLRQTKSSKYATGIMMTLGG